MCCRVVRCCVVSFEPLLYALNYACVTNGLLVDSVYTNVQMYESIGNNCFIIEIKIT